MNLRLLEIFRAVMQASTTTAAAKYLGISQPAVSSAIKNFEAQLNITLFTRTGNRIVPTEEAKILYEESEPIFLASKSLEYVVENLKESQLGSLRIIATPQLGHTVIPKAIYHLLSDRPKLKITLDVWRSYSVIDTIKNGGADLGFAVALEKDLTKIVDLTSVATIEIVCLLTKDHKLAGNSYLSPKDIANFPIIGLEMGTRIGPLVSNLFRETGVPYKTVVETRYSETSCLLAKEGVGIAIIDKITALSYLKSNDNLKIIPLLPSIVVNVSAVFPKNHIKSNMTQHFVQLTKQLISDFYT